MVVRSATSRVRAAATAAATVARRRYQPPPAPPEARVRARRSLARTLGRLRWSASTRPASSSTGCSSREPLPSHGRCREARGAAGRLLCLDSNHLCASAVCNGPASSGRLPTALTDTIGRAAHRYLCEALLMYERGVASASDIDTVRGPTRPEWPDAHALRNITAPTRGGAHHHPSSSSALSTITLDPKHGA